MIAGAGVSYLIYALACAYFGDIVNLFCPFKNEEFDVMNTEEFRDTVGARASLGGEPAANFAATGEERQGQSLPTQGESVPTTTSLAGVELVDGAEAGYSRKQQGSVQMPTAIPRSRSNSNGRLMSQDSVRSDSMSSSARQSSGPLLGRDSIDTGLLFMASVAPKHIAQVRRRQARKFACLSR